MSDIAINPVTRRVQFTGNTGTGPYAFTFNILTSSDIAVFKGTTELTLTTDYSVSINSNGTGSITLVVALIASDVLTIIGGRELSRTTDFVTAGDLLASSLNEQLDSNVIMTQQLDEKLNRGLYVNPGDVYTDLELPLKDARKGKILAFNETTGDPEPGPVISEFDTVSAISADIKTLAEIQDGTVATAAITNVNTIRANVTTVSGISGNVTSVANISANVTTVAGISGNVTTVAGDATEIAAVAGNSTNINTVAGQTTNLQNVTDNLAAIQNSPANATAAAGSASAAAGSASAASGSATAASDSAAAAAAAFDSFDDKYLGSKTGYATSGTGPSVDNDGNALVEGALFFSADANEMRVYDGANWIAASSSGTASLIIYEFTATSGQTTFSGTDGNGATLGYTALNIIVALNGAILDPSDYTASNGTSIVLGAGATTGDLLNVYAFASFSVADTVSRSSGGTFAAGITVQGNIAVTGDANITSKIGLGGTNYGTAGQVIKSAGSGAAAVWGSAPAPFAPVAVTGATPSLNVGTYNYFDNGTLTANTTVSFASVPTTASWTYTAKGSLLTSAAYNLTVAAYESKLSIASEEANLRGLEFSTDGTFLYVIGSAGKDVNQYTLTTAFDVTTATFTRAFSISAQEDDPTGVDFKTDGTEMYVIGKDGDDVNQYTLSTAWNVSTATFTRAFSVAAQEINLTGIDFKTDGTEMYLIGSQGLDVNQYTLTTAWDISSASFTRLFSVSAKDTNPTDVKFRSDGLGMFILGYSRAVHHYTLSSAWNISSATFTTSFSVSSLVTSPEGLAFNADGTRMYVGGTDTDSIYQYRTAPYATLTLPSSVVDPPSTAIEETTATYNFVTLDGGTTVSFVNNSPAAAPVPQSTEAGAIGTYSFGRPISTTAFAIGATSSSFYAWQQTSEVNLMHYESGASPNFGTAVSQSGTWRCMSGAANNDNKGWCGLWVRIS